MTLLQTLVELAEPFRPLLPLLAALVGAVIAWLAIHHVARLSAKRAAYGRYIGAAEMYAHDWARWVNARRRLVGAAVPKVSAREVNEPLGDVLLVAPAGTAELFHEAQQKLTDLTVASQDYHNWDPAWKEWRAVRQRLINQARKETGVRPFPDRFFREPGQD